MNYYLIIGKIIFHKGLRWITVPLFGEKAKKMIRVIDEIEKLEKEALVAFDEKVNEIKERLLHDVSIPYNKLNQAVINEVKLLRQRMIFELNNKTKLLLVDLKNPTKK